MSNGKTWVTEKGMGHVAIRGTVSIVRCSYHTVSFLLINYTLILKAQALNGLFISKPLKNC